MVARFFCPEIGGETTALDEAESHHAVHVMRLAVGDRVELFDGSGMVADGSVSAITRRSVHIAMKDRRTVVPPKRSRLIVAAAPPKGDRLKLMIEKLTEIGVDEYIPLKSVRSVVDPRQSKLEKLRSTMIAAMKQSGRDRFLQIRDVTDLSGVLRNAASEKYIIRLAHPGNSSAAEPPSPDRDVLLLIGPEGGFTSEEILQATDHGAIRMVWPDTVLRIETAAIVFSGLLLNGLSQHAP